MSAETKPNKSASTSSSEPSHPSRCRSSSPKKPLPSSTDIRSILHQYISAHHLDLPRQQLLLSRLRQAGLLSSHASTYQQTTGFLRPHKRYLQVRAERGQAFVDEFVEGEVKHGAPSLLQLWLHFLGQRWGSHPVLATAEPQFNHTFLFPLQDEHDNLPLATLPSLVSLASPIHLSIVRQDQRGHMTLLSTADVEWRKVLVHGSVSLSVSLYADDDNTRPVGILHLSLDVIPLRLPSSPAVLPVFVEKAVLAKSLHDEQLLVAAVKERFHEYAKAWWQDWSLARPSHHSRVLSLFLPSDQNVPTFVCCLLGKLRCEGGVESPLHAARLVRLIAHKRECRLGGVRREVAHGMSALLARRCGDVEEHCFLLCSLLLGFGLDAWVAVGTNSSGVHYVVLTRHDSHHLTLWDACTGVRYDINTAHKHKPVRPAAATDRAQGAVLPLDKLYCLFNDHSFLANNQVEDDVLLVDWQLEDDGSWKRMKEEAIAALPRFTPFVLQPCSIDPLQAARKLEHDLIALITTYRQQLANLTSVFSPALSYLLAPALSSYESDRLAPSSPSAPAALLEADFQAAVQHSVALHSVFRAVPFQFHGLETRELMNAMLSNAAFVAMVNEGETSGGAEGLEYGVRCKVVPYCEEVMAVWVIVACTQPATLVPVVRSK